MFLNIAPQPTQIGHHPGLRQSRLLRMELRQQHRLIPHGLPNRGNPVRRKLCCLERDFERLAEFGVFLAEGLLHAFELVEVLD